MTDQDPDDYLRRLERGLKGLPRSERSRIVKEIRSHIDGRGAEAMAGLGDPITLARSFAEDYHAAREATFGEEASGLAGGIRRSLRVSFGMTVFAGAVLVSAGLYFIGVAGGAFAIGKYLFPRNIGCWSTKARGPGGEMSCYFSSTPPVIPAGASDPGAWIAPLAALIAVIAFVIATFLLVSAARRFLVRPVFDAYRAARRGGMPIVGGAQ
jgi:hypothetical protein